MTDRDKLIKLFSPFADGTYNGSGTFIDGTKVDDVVDNLLANGVFILPEDLRGTEDFSISAFIEAMQMYKEKDRYIKPPCKVGDTVYVVSQGQGLCMRWNVYEGKVVDIHLNRHNKLTIRVENGEKFFGYYEPCFIFLTKEEAEAKLKELENDEM